MAEPPSLNPAENPDNLTVCVKEGNMASKWCIMGSCSGKIEPIMSKVEFS